MNTPPQPIERAERIGMLDTTRGVAVLGILIMNITGFGLPHAYDDPSNWGGHEGANLWVWRVAALLFEGTMRGLFTLLFGAGALLFLQRHAARTAGLRPADLYFRRTMCLIAFGLLNGYVLLWKGDIQFYYGVVGLLLFVFRNVTARRLIVIATIVNVPPNIPIFIYSLSGIVYPASLAYSLSYPFPKTINLVQVSSSRPIGPRE